MQVNYCDLCGTPLKENCYFILYVSEPKYPIYENLQEYYNTMKKVEKEVKEICPTCKQIFDKIFELKLKRLSELANEINSIYNLQSKPNPKERKNGKEKK